jgi:thiol-disulfide isomerase/thioredoxin
MIKRIGVALVMLLVVSFIAACSTASSNTPVPAQKQPDSEPTVSSSIDVGSTYRGPGWTTIPLTDGRTSATFTLESFAGKTVFVEPMATWCTNCRHQLPNVEAARVQLNPDQYVFVGLSVAENVDNATLAKYVDGNGWHFRFAIAPEAFVKGMVDTFGRTAVTPPSTPHFIIRPDGSLTEMKTGSHSADELIAELKAASKR